MIDEEFRSSNADKVTWSRASKFRKGNNLDRIPIK